MLFWGVDPLQRYPRYWTRYAPEPAGMFVPDGRRSRTVVAVDIDDCRGPADADARVTLSSGDELATLTWMTAILSDAPGRESASPEARHLAQRLAESRYALVTADAEGDVAGATGTLRAQALAALAQAINVTARGALSLLRGGGNRSGAESVLTSQTGYPAAIDFTAGYPTYRPHRHLADVRADAVLVLGAADRLPSEHSDALAAVPAVVIGPRASASPLRGAVVLDTGVAGIHSAGTAVRMDDLPIPLHAIVTGPPDAAVLCGALRERLAGGH
jgi:formylmethanofuran dehydrogenase subunit B